MAGKMSGQGVHPMPPPQYDTGRESGFTSPAKPDSGTSTGKAALAPANIK